MNKIKEDIVVVGAGVIGINCALALQQDGHSVTLVDRDLPGEGCSSGNAGLFARSAFAPLAGPGVLFDVPKWLLDPLGPLAVRWSYMPKMIPWLMRYIQSGTVENQLRISNALYPLVNPSVEMYEALAKQAGTPELVTRSAYMYAYRNEKSFKKSAGEMALRREFGVEVQELKGEEIRDAEPALSSEITHAYYVPDHGFTVDPLGLMQSLSRLFIKRGGTFTQSNVKDVRLNSMGKALIVCDDRQLEADRVVITLGAFSKPFAKRLGASVPLDTERGYHVTIPFSGVSPKIPVMSGDDKFLATPMSMGLRLAGTVEFGGVEAKPDYRRAQALITHGKKMFPGLAADEFSQWMGCRPTMPDSMPVMGFSSESDRVLFAFGHQHIGLTAGPMSGKVIADLVAGRKTTMDISQFKSDRF